MLVSPRPVALVTPTSNYSPATGTKGNRAFPYSPREDRYIVSSGRQSTQESSSTMILPLTGSIKETSGRTSSSNPPKSRPEFPREESLTSVKSRDSTSSLNRTVSGGSI